MDLQLTEKQIHIDNSGYYTYVLLNGNSSIKDKVEELLKAKYQILLSGKSFRPASNNKQYDWYIRIAEQDGNLKPALVEIKKTLKPILIYSSSEVVNLKKEINNLKLQLQQCLNEITSKREILQHNLHNIERYKRENQRLSLKNSQLADKINELEDAALQPKNSSSENHKDLELQKEILLWDVNNLLSQNKRLKNEIKEKESDYQSIQDEYDKYLANFDPELSRKDERIKTLEIECTNKDNTILILEDKLKHSNSED